MGGGLLNLVAKGNINVILNGNPQKTFLKKHMLNIQILDFKDLRYHFIMRIV